MRAVLFVAVLLAGCVPPAPRNTVSCYPVSSNGWTFDCEVTGRGEEKHEGQFSPQLINRIANQGDDLDRSFRGERWWAVVKVEQAGSESGVERGREYKLYGTVKGISGNRVSFTDCVFAPSTKDDGQ